MNAPAMPSWAAIIEAAREAGCAMQLRAIAAMLITTSARGHV